MNADAMKKAAAEAALAYVEPGMIVGIGTGSTANHFIDLLASMKNQIDGTVASSVASAKRLEGYGIRVMNLNEAGQLSLYVDGADESNAHLQLIKGGGGALTLEKNVAINSKKIIWIVDESKLVHRLSGFPLPVEVLPISCEQNFKRFEQEGLKPRWRMDGNQRYVTHYGNYIIPMPCRPRGMKAVCKRSCWWAPPPAVLILHRCQRRRTNARWCCTGRKMTPCPCSR